MQKKLDQMFLVWGSDAFTALMWVVSFAPLIGQNEQFEDELDNKNIGVDFLT